MDCVIENNGNESQIYPQTKHFMLTNNEKIYIKIEDILNKESVKKLSNRVKAKESILGNYEFQDSLFITLSSDKMIIDYGPNEVDDIIVFTQKCDWLNKNEVKFKFRASNIQKIIKFLKDYDCNDSELEIILNSKDNFRSAMIKDVNSDFFYFILSPLRFIENQK